MDSSSTQSVSEVEYTSTDGFAGGTPVEKLMRPVVLGVNGLQYQWHVLETQGLLTQRALGTVRCSLEANGESEKPQSIPELITATLSLLVQQIRDASAYEPTICISELLDAFENDFLRESNIHILADEVADCPKRKQEMVRSYLAALAATGRSSPSACGKAALFGGNSQSYTNTYAVFGGICDASDLLEELRSLWEVYRHLVEPLLKVATGTLLGLLAAAGPSTAREYPHGLDVLLWLNAPEKAPSQEYLHSTAVNFPLTGLVQFATYAVVCNQLNLSPGQVTNYFRGMSGQSQGIVAAATLARVTNWEDFRRGLIQATTILFHLGSAAQEYTPRPSIPWAVSEEALSNGEGVCSPMLHIFGCAQDRLDRSIETLNQSLEPSAHVSIGILNGPCDVVAVGPALSLCALAAILRKIKAPSGTDQNRVAVSKRKPEFSLRFLPGSAPLHSVHLTEAAAQALRRLELIQVTPSEFRLATFDSHMGEDMRNNEAANILSELAQLVLCTRCDWAKATSFRDATHVVDFGPGGTSGAGSLVQRIKDGTQARVVLAGLACGNDQQFGYRAELFHQSAVIKKSWLEEFGPSVVRLEDGRIELKNKMTLLLGLPPVMVAGMTPTTASWEFVSTVMNAGYHAELAAGGLHSAQDFTRAVHHLAETIPRGRGICINVIYASPKQIKWQIPLVRKLLSEGQPIDGITFGAGVPSRDVAQEYIEMGLHYISFKPGSAPAIEQVIEIARANKGFPIILQWTGGRGGGHHSYEDFHGPMLQMYGRIRQCRNIVLLAGSGFGGADDTYPYISGRWSVAFQRPAMPFDGILFGSRMMVAREAKTSRGAKEAIVAAPGVDEESSWDQSYSKPCGGIVTVRSEMGEPIHKVATRGVLLWKELDDTVFSIDSRAKRLDKLKGMKSYLVDRLNNDSQKVWFGKDVHGYTVDLEDMTYGEILKRLVQLLYVSKDRRWIHQSYMQLTVEFVKRMCSHGPGAHLNLPSDFGLGLPLEAVDRICEQCHATADRVISYRDARFFVMICKRPGQKPPTFVPVIDEDFEQWFKKDSLWQSEDLAAVVDEDAGRVCILQGPVAARYSTIVDEPVQQILDAICEGHISRMIRDCYADDRSRVPPKPAGPLEKLPVSMQFFSYHEGGRSHYEISSAIAENFPPNEGEWFRSLAGSSGTWLYDMVMSRDVIQGTKFVANPIRRVLSPARSMHVSVTHAHDEDLIELALHNAEPSNCSSRNAPYSFTIRKGTDIVVTFYIRQSVESVTLPIVFKFRHHPATPLHPIHEVMEGLDERLQDFYYRLWLGSGTERSMHEKMLAWTPSLLQSPIPRITDQGQVITGQSIKAFAESIHYSGPEGSFEKQSSTAGVDFAMVIGWQALISSVFAPAIDARFLNLVHLSNEFVLLDDCTTLAAGDLVSSSAQVVGVRDESMGRIVRVEAAVTKEHAPFAQVTSEFLFRNAYADSSLCFQKRLEPPLFIHVDTPAKAAVLKSKDWIQWGDGSMELFEQRLTFEVESLQYFGNVSGVTETWGTVYDENKRILGSIHHHQYRNDTNAPLDFLKSYTRPLHSVQQLPHPQPLSAQCGLTFTTPGKNLIYSKASGDFNPIHTSVPFARYAGLPGTITHGMWTSAAVRKLIQKAAGCNVEVRMRSYKVTFLAMLLPGAMVRVDVNHVAMKQGRRVLNFEAWNTATKEKVIAGEAIVDQAKTAYVFTGQGSQQVGMGMQLYASCGVARDVWDKADQFYSLTYGFRISDIVRRNPKQLIVHFGGRRGEAIKRNYIQIRMENNGRSQQVLRSINEASIKHVFKHSEGLLFSTLFAQPALTVMEHAQYAHLQSKSLIAADAMFAGHSLGEYTAVSTIGHALPFEKLLAVTFFRALIMNAAVTRNAQGSSEFGMIAINPSRVSSHIDTLALREITATIAASTGELLEVVNYNIEMQQYVATGSLKALACLSTVIEQLTSKAPMLALGASLLDAGLDEIVANAANWVATQPSSMKLERGVATLPLEGVDVPFHSTYLLPSMPAFRHVLETYIERVDARRFVGKWVTNVTGQPFDISKQTIQQVYETTKSRVLGDLLEKMR